MKEQQRIVGVYSKSETQPLMKVFTGEGRQGFSDAVTYAGWAFIYKPTNNSSSASPAVGDAPVVAGSPTVVPVTPPPPPASNSDDPCARQAASDYAICIETCKLEPFGVCTACYASLRERTLACKQSRSVPELVTK
jgi:hypothetical protein